MPTEKYVRLRIQPNQNLGGRRHMYEGYGTNGMLRGDEQLWLNITCAPSGCGESGQTFPVTILLRLHENAGNGYEDTGRDVAVDLGFGLGSWEGFEIPDAMEVFDSPSDSANKIETIRKDDLLRLRIR